MTRDEFRAKLEVLLYRKQRATLAWAGNSLAGHTEELDVAVDSAAEELVTLVCGAPLREGSEQ